MQNDNGLTTESEPTATDQDTPTDPIPKANSSMVANILAGLAVLLSGVSLLLTISLQLEQQEFAVRRDNVASLRNSTMTLQINVGKVKRSTLWHNRDALMGSAYRMSNEELRELANSVFESRTAYLSVKDMIVPEHRSELDQEIDRLAPTLDKLARISHTVAA